MREASAYVELHAHSAFSFLDGASTPVELADAAADLGYGVRADRSRRGLGLDGVRPRLQGLGCRQLDIRAITGAEVTVRLADAQHAHLTLLVEDAGGYRNLCRLLTAAHSHTRETPQRRAGQPR